MTGSFTAQCAQTRLFDAGKRRRRRCSAQKLCRTKARKRAGCWSCLIPPKDSAAGQALSHWSLLGSKKTSLWLDVVSHKPPREPTNRVSLATVPPVQPNLVCHGLPSLCKTLCTLPMLSATHYTADPMDARLLLYPRRLTKDPHRRHSARRATNRRLSTIGFGTVGRPTARVDPKPNAMPHPARPLHRSPLGWLAGTWLQHTLASKKMYS